MDGWIRLHTHSTVMPCTYSEEWNKVNSQRSLQSFFSQGSEMPHPARGDPIDAEYYGSRQKGWWILLVKGSSKHEY